MIFKELFVMVYNKSLLLSKDYIKLICVMYMSLFFIFFDKDFCLLFLFCVFRRVNMIKIVWG